MRDSQPVSLESLLESGTKDNNTLKSIQQRAVVLLKLNRAVVALLPAMLKPHCRVANYRKQLLILEVSNAAQMTGCVTNFPHCVLHCAGDFTIIIGHRHQNQSVIDEIISNRLLGGDKSSNSDSRGQKQQSGTEIKC